VTVVHSFDINVSHIATQMRFGGIFNKYFAANLLENLTVNFFLKIGRINRVTVMSLVSSPFSVHGVKVCSQHMKLNWTPV